MDWTENALILTAGRHGEHHAIADVLTLSRGRWRGLVRGGKGRRLSGVLQPGNEVVAHWRARVESQLGTLTIEPVKSRIGTVLGDRIRLMGLMSATTLLAACLPEREAHPAVYEATVTCLDLLGDSAVADMAWGAGLVRLELGLLADLGYGLDLRYCAATGTEDNLIYVSPKSGRAVSADAGRPWHDRLLPLPAFLLGRQAGQVDYRAVADGMMLTGFFLERYHMEARGRALPSERDRLLAYFKKRAGD